MQRPKLYSKLASWFPLLSDGPEDYAEEAAFARDLLIAATDPPPRTLLELGSGAGSNASHLKASFQLTLTDLSEEMLAVSRARNPECEHLQGDMRTLRLGRLFDAVFLHDAVMYMTTEADLRSAMETAFAHCKPGGVALFEPDYVHESYKPETDHGGHDGPDRAMRYLEWHWDPDPDDTVMTVDYAFLLREADGSVRIAHDRHLEGLFSRDTWFRLLRETGFEPKSVIDAYERDLFIANKPL